MRYMMCVEARWYNFEQIATKLQQVCIYLVHSSLLHHTEQAYHPKPERKRKKRL